MAKKTAKKEDEFSRFSIHEKVKVHPVMTGDDWKIGRIKAKVGDTKIVMLNIEYETPDAQGDVDVIIQSCYVRKL